MELAASMAVIVKEYVPTAVGMPEIILALRESPGGREPEVTAEVYGLVPPLGVMSWLYNLPMVADGRLGSIIVDGLTVMVYLCDPVKWLGSASVAVILKSKIPAAVGEPVMVLPVSVNPVGRKPLVTLKV
jgi:hypothetical protein